MSCARPEDFWRFRVPHAYRVTRRALRLRLNDMKRTALLALVMLVAAACGSEPAASTTTQMSGTSTTALVTTTAAPTTSLPTPSSTVVTSTTTTLAPVTTTTLPGTSVDFGPADGDILSVVGVRHDDSLNLRPVPGTGQPPLAAIPPTADRLRAEGETRRVGEAFWTRVTYQGVTGWVHMGYVGYAGIVEDGTAETVTVLGGYPEEATLAALGAKVASVYESDEVESRVVQVTPGSAGDLHEIVFDVIGFADDSVGGARLIIFAEKTASGFRLKSVEVMAICSRGVDADRACV